GGDENRSGPEADHGVRASRALRARRAVKHPDAAARPGDRAYRRFTHFQPIRLRGTPMKPTQALHDLGQSLWLDNITRDILDKGTLRRYVDELSVTGLTSNPTIFDEAIGGGTAYDEEIQRKTKAGVVGEALFMELALEDLRRAADLFRPIYDRTGG